MTVLNLGLALFQALSGLYQGNQKAQASLLGDERLHEEKLRSRLILQVHDEILVETYEPEKDKVTDIIKDSMMNAVDFRVPLEIDINEGKNWFEAH